MAKIVAKKVREQIVKLRDVEHLGWAAIGQQTGLHRETVKKHYLLQKREGASPPAPGKGLVPSGHVALGESSVKQELELMDKRQNVLQIIDKYVAIVEGGDWAYVEEEVLLLEERLEFLRARGKGAKDIDTLSEIEGLVFEEIDNLHKLGEQQAEAEKKVGGRERQKKLSSIKEYYLDTGGSKRDVQRLIDHLAKHGGIEEILQLIKDEEALAALRAQCFEAGIDSRFVEDVLWFAIPKMPSITYVRQLWWDAQRISYKFGFQEFAWFWNSWGRFAVQGKQPLWLTFVRWKVPAQPT